MDNVVKLDKKTKGRPSASAKRSAPGRSRPSKTALVLGGGGFTGGVYEIGALRALDLLSVNRTVNEFDVYVGTSAGAFVGALAANGVTPEEMMRVVDRRAPASFKDIDLGTLLRPNLGEYLQRAVKMPFKTVGVLRELVSQLGREFSLMDVIVGLGEGLPTGVYSGDGVRRYLERVLAEPGRSNDFRKLANELYLIATDLDSCERVVFGQDEWDDVPISAAVTASTALPMVYKPVELKGRELVDGGIVSTTNLDIAIEAGAKLVIVINPVVPFINEFDKEIPTLLGSRPRRVSDMGFPHIGYQTFKLLAYQRLHEMASHWQERYPGVDIILIEPDSDDELMFQTNVMNFASRVEIARHGFQSVTLKLAKDYHAYREICERHGIKISATRVRKVVRHFATEEEERTSAWRRILEQTTGSVLRQSADQ